ncbi:hypothetical protein BTA11_14490 [Enterococcus faecium]|nr:hypothetical protein BTA11_14490 [Enterococcus faecium]
MCSCLISLSLTLISIIKSYNFTIPIIYEIALFCNTIFQKNFFITILYNENAQTVDKVHFMDDVYSLFFYNRFMKTNARSDSYDV